MEFTNENIPISKIKIIENSRVNKKGVASLMESIKNQGLQQPIGVHKENDHYVLVWGNRRLQACKNLGMKSIEARVYTEKIETKDFLIANLVENTQREDVTAMELGRIVDTLQRKHGMNHSEIGVRIGRATNQVKMAHELYARLPSRYRDRVVFAKSTHLKTKDQIPATTALIVTNMLKAKGLPQGYIDKMMDYAIRNNVSTASLTLLSQILKKEKSWGKAVKKFNTYQRVDLIITLPKQELRKLMITHNKNTPGGAVMAEFRKRVKGVL